MLARRLRTRQMKKGQFGDVVEGDRFQDDRDQGQEGTVRELAPPGTRIISHIRG